MCDELKCKEDGHYLHSVQSVVIISSCVEKLIYGGNALPTTQDDIVKGVRQTIEAVLRKVERRIVMMSVVSLTFASSPAGTR